MLSNQEFQSLPWHDAELLKIGIDRTSPGISDTIIIDVRWPDKRKSQVVFSECWGAEFKMNMGVIAQETVRDAHCYDHAEAIEVIKRKWKDAGVNLSGICCYEITTNSTNSMLRICAKAISNKYV